MIKVVNKSLHEIDPYISTPQKEYFIGRGSVLGNPFTSKPLDKTKAKFKCDTKKEAIDNYKDYLLKEIESNNKEIISTLDEIEENSTNGIVYLICYCKPSGCHGDIIKKLIDDRIESRRTKTLF